MATKPQGQYTETKFGVHVLVVVFGITSWSITNGLWVELPILVTQLPEGWTLPSYLTIITQLGNVGLILFSLIAYLMPKAKLETAASFLIVAALTLCALLYAFFWKETAHVAGGVYSVALLGLTFSQAVFAATTSIAYVTFMARLKVRYMASIFIGMGISGLIPAFAALGQGLGNARCVQGSNTSFSVYNVSNGSITYGDSSNVLPLNAFGTKNLTQDGATNQELLVSEEPPFSVQAFFLMLFGTGILSLVSLLMLVFHPYCRSEHVDDDGKENTHLMQLQSQQEAPSTITSDTHGSISVPTSPATGSDAHVTIGYDSSTRTKNDNFALSEILDTQVTSPHTTATPNVIVFIPGEAVAITEYSQDNSTTSFNEVHKVTDITDTTDNKKYKTLLLTEGMAGADALNVKDNSDDAVNETIENCEEETPHSDKGKQISKLESWYLLGLLVWINALQTSFVLAIQVYSSLPYGLAFYHAATKAENIVDPMASFLTFWITARTTPVLSGLTLLGTIFIAYIIVAAAMSPYPILVNETAGGILVVTAWVMCTILMVFSKVSIAKIMRVQGRQSLMWTGATTQLGSMTGAIVAYVVINCLHLFKDEPWCQ